jgi:hypothetical protein
LRLAKAISAGGLPLFGKGTRLTRRYLRTLHDEGVRLVEVEPDAQVERWERVPDVNEFVMALEERFAEVKSDPRMRILKQAVADVYLDFLFEIEG